MKILYKKELSYYLNNPIGYIVVVLLGVFANFLFVKDLFLVGSASMRSFFAMLPWLLMIFIPALSMRILAEEKRTNTMEILLSLPVSETQIVLAKFFALLTVVCLALGTTVALPVSLGFLTKMYLPEIFIGYVGVVLLAASFIGLSMFFSGKTTNQVIAFLSSAIIIFVFLVLATDFTGAILPKFIQDFLSYFGPSYHLQNFIKGVVDLRSLFYFLSLDGLFLLMTITDLKKRK